MKISTIRFADGTKIEYLYYGKDSPIREARHYLETHRPDLVDKFDTDMEARCKGMNRLGDTMGQHTGVERFSLRRPFPIRGSRIKKK